MCVCCRASLELDCGFVRSMFQCVSVAFPVRPFPFLLGLSEKGKAVRVINNNLEVAEALQDVGWNVAMFDDEDHLSIESACKLFNSAELILGPHGAGFTNMLCACGGTTIIEFLQSDSMRNPSFIILAKELDFNYIAIETLPPYILPYKGGEGLVNSTLIAAVSAGVLEERNRGQRKRQC